MTNTGSVAQGSFAVAAVLVDCDIVKKRKREIQWSSPADLMKILGSRALDESCTAIPLKQLAARNVGGRKQLVTEQQRFFMIGRSVDQKIHRFESGFALLKTLKIGGVWESNAQRKALTKHFYNSKEIEALLISRTPRGAAKRYVTEYVLENKVSLQTVRSSYSRYLKAKS
jgi:hypothetical protein